MLMCVWRSEVEAIRNGEVVKLSSAELVPGDIIVLQPGTLPADVVLLRGECIVDENMLTGRRTKDVQWAGSACRTRHCCKEASKSFGVESCCALSPHFGTPAAGLLRRRSNPPRGSSASITACMPGNQASRFTKQHCMYDIGAPSPGESVPVRKVCYSPVADGQSYQPDKSPGCTLFGGTLVAQARAPRNQKAVGMVCRTRFYSAKGQLLR